MFTLTLYPVAAPLIAQAAEFEILDYLSRAGVIVFFIVFIYGFMKPKPWWVSGSQYQDLLDRYNARGTKLEKAVENADAWKEQALTGTRLARDSANIAQAAVERGRIKRGSVGE